MSPAALSVLSIPSPVATTVDFVGRTGRNYRYCAFKMTCARSKSEHDDVSTKHKIVVFCRNSLKSNISNRMQMQELEINAIYDLDEGVPTTSRTYPQDDCLHTERAPFRSLRGLAPSALHVRARYNFHQGLVNTKEVLEAQGCAGNAHIAEIAGPK
jgi:hypothetical protein